MSGQILESHAAKYSSILTFHDMCALLKCVGAQSGGINKEEGFASQ